MELHANGKPEDAVMGLMPDRVSEVEGFGVGP